MKIGFTVGNTEPHQMELSFDLASGALLITMDGTQVLEDERALTRPVKTYELNIGDCEKHRLALQLTYGEQPEEPDYRPVPRLSLMLSPVVP